MRSQSQQIDLALEVLDAIIQPGETLTAQDLAEVIGCSKQYIYFVEKRAIEKLKQHFAGRSRTEFDGSDHYQPNQYINHLSERL